MHWKFFFFTFFLFWLIFRIFKMEVFQFFDILDGFAKVARIVWQYDHTFLFFVSNDQMSSRKQRIYLLHWTQMHFTQQLLKPSLIIFFLFKFNQQLDIFINK